MTDKYKPHQKEFIEELDPRPSYPPQVPSVPDRFDNPSRIKSDIRRGPADPETVIKRVREFVEYLDLVDTFYRHIEDQPKGLATWELCQIALGSEADTLRRTLKKWGPETKRSPRTWGTELEDRLRPLWNDVEPFEEWDNIPKSAGNDELNARVDALKRLLKDIAKYDPGEGKYLHELLEFVAKNGGNPNERLDDRRFWRASRLLDKPADATQKDHLHLIEEGIWGYDMTGRGHAVLNTFRNLVSFWDLPIEEPNSQEAVAGAEDLITILEIAFGQD